MFSSYLKLSSDLCPKITFLLLIPYVVGYILQVHINEIENKTETPNLTHFQRLIIS